MQFIVIDLSCENAIAEGDPEGSLNIIVLWVGTGRSYFYLAGSEKFRYNELRYFVG